MSRTWPGISSPIMTATAGRMPNDTCAAVRSDRAICHANMRVSCINRPLCSGGSPSKESGSQTAADGASITRRHHLSFVKCRSRVTNGIRAARLRASGCNLIHKSRLAESAGTCSAISAAASSVSNSRQCSFSWCTRTIDWHRFQRGASAGGTSRMMSSALLTHSSAQRHRERHSYYVFAELLWRV